FHKILPLIGRCVSKHKDAYRYLPQSVDDFESVDTILNYLREFEIEDARRYSLTLGGLGLFIGRKREV
ncbi:MAG: class I SAM-dependent methyltransferase, partial [Thermoguttaceae bacterium]|nr:class I SAM-dependent methyltransferase [Thermoguttaceae bacterium]